MFPFCSGASTGARGASGTEPLREEGWGETGEREGQSRAQGWGPVGGLDLGTDSCCHRGEPASLLKRGG